MGGGFLLLAVEWCLWPHRDSHFLLKVRTRGTAERREGMRIADAHATPTPLLPPSNAASWAGHQQELRVHHGEVARAGRGRHVPLPVSAQAAVASLLAPTDRCCGRQEGCVRPCRVLFQPCRTLAGCSERGRPVSRCRGGLAAGHVGVASSAVNGCAAIRRRRMPRVVPTLAESAGGRERFGMLVTGGGRGSCSHGANGQRRSPQPPPPLPPPHPAHPCCRPTLSPAGARGRVHCIASAKSLQGGPGSRDAREISHAALDVVSACVVLGQRARDDVIARCAATRCRVALLASLLS
jgi:hypothetical protein